MRFLIYWPFLICFLMLSACRLSSPVEHGELYIPRWAPDSVKQLLASGELSGGEEVSAYAWLGINYNVRGEYDTGRKYLYKGLEKPGGMEYQGGRMLVNLANSYGFQGQYAEALKYYMEALQLSERLAERSDDTGWFAKFNIIRTMANMSEIHYLTGNREQALHYAWQAREHGLVWGESYVTPQYLYVIGCVFLDRGELDEAEQFLRGTFEISDEYCRARLEDGGEASGMYMYVAYGLEGLARVYLARTDYDRALEYGREALENAYLHGDPTVTAKMFSVLSDIYMALGDHTTSGEYAAMALEQFPGHGKVNPEVLFNLASGHLSRGNAESAFEYFSLYSRNIRENTDKQFRETMAGLQVQYEIEKKETRIGSLEQQRRLYLLIAFLGVLIIFALWAVTRQKIRQERQEKQLIAAQAVYEWEKKERKRFASDLHDGINGMLSAVKIELNTGLRLQLVRARIDECIETIRRMARGMMPGSLERYGLKAALEDYCRLFPNVDFHFYGQDKRMTEQVELMVYYCVYELVNNAYKHSGATSIHVQLVQDGDSVSVTVHDDGCGFDPAGRGDDSGLRNIRDRVESFNGRLDIAAFPGEGTEINILII